MKYILALSLVLCSCAGSAYGDQILKPCSDNDEEIKVLKFHPPGYPSPPVRRKFLEGKVLLKVMVSSSGQADSIQVVESEPEGYFDESVLYAAKKSEYSKSENAELRCGMWLIRFKLDDEN
jgi:TonB family protein